MLSGTVLNASTGDSLTAVNIRVLGTSRGTITNSRGRYTITLDQGTYTLIFSSLAFRPDTETVHLFSDTRLDASLVPADIVLPEVTVTAEDPAIEIIRRAIANKRRWLNTLASYEFDAFTRQTLMRDTAIASITESYTKGYWQQGDTLREVIIQRRQTANIQPEFNLASVGRMLNFNDDEIRFLGYRFVGPTAPDALDEYDYKLLRTRTSRGHEMYEIRMIPRTRTVPLFDGTVTIAGGSYALAGVDVEPNEAFLIPFVKDKSVRYRQQFGLYDNIYWLPTDIRIEASFTVGVAGFSIPRIGIDQTSVIYNYSVNTPVPDSVFRKPHLVVDSAAATVDSSFWAKNAVLPLNPRERIAYETIDSTKTLDVQFRPGGIGALIGFGSESAGALLSSLDLSFNRVEGAHLGLKTTLDSLITGVSLRGGIAFGTADRMTKYLAGATFYVSPARTFGVGADFYRSIDQRPDQGYYGSLFNSLTSLLGKNDYHNYYLAEGWRVFAASAPSHQLATELSYRSERNSSAAVHSQFSLLFPSRDYRPNPSAEEGTLRSLQLSVRLGPEPVPLDLITRDMVELSAEHSSPSLEGGVFSFTRVTGIVTIVLPTIAQDYLLKPELRIRLSGGTSSGTLPPQRYFDLEGQSSGYAPFGVLDGVRPKEFSGTRYFAFSAEHNFRTLPFLALGIPFLYENNLELVVHGAAAKTWNTGGVPWNITGGTYAEAGFGLSRILDLIRADVSWRFMKPVGLSFTLSVANLF